MNWISFSLVFLLLQGTAARQDRGSITGYIVKMGSGEPISKATVTLSVFNGGRAQSYTATTTTNGQFAFQNLEAGQYRLSATRSGYVRMEYGARTPNRAGLPLTVNAGQSLANIVVSITPAGTITGRVFDRDGEPLANVMVEALKYVYQEGQRTLNVAQTARTNDLGEYRLFWLQPGQYFVSATPPEGQRGALLNALAVAGPGIAGAIGDLGNRGRGGGPPVVRADDPGQSLEGYIPVYYPGTIDPQSAAPIKLASGALFTGVDLTVMSVRTLRVQGQVVNGATGQPATNANVMLIPVQRTAGGGFRGGIRNPGNLRTQINNQGTFEIRGVPPGSYELMAMSNQRNSRMSARLPLEIGAADVQNVSLILTPGFTITGRLTVEGQQSVAGNQSAGNQTGARMRVMLRPDSAGQVAGSQPAGATQADGTFTLEQVGRDDYRVAVSGLPRNAYIKSATLGGIDVLNQDLRLERQPTGSLEIVVSMNSGTADGLVQNEKQQPASNVTVTLIPESRRNRMDLYRTISTDAAGRFHLEGVAPGDYRVFAWEEVDNGAWQDLEFLRQFEDRGKMIRINEGAASNVELRAIPPQ
jgi:5-hydroxyisourate hydrolase-like protein (transthyretin family)